MQRTRQINHLVLSLFIMLSIQDLNFDKLIYFISAIIIRRFPFKPSMSKKDLKEKLDKKRQANQNSQLHKTEDILGEIQKKGIQMQLSLSPSQIQTLNAEHHLLIPSSTMSELIKSFDKEIFPQIKQHSNPEITKLYATWREWMENSIQKINHTERKDLAAELMDTDKQPKNNPMDDYQKRKSQILSRQIREREEFFKIKTNFAAYAKNNFQKPTQHLKDFVDYKAKRVDERTVQEMFKKQEQRKLNEINNYFQQKEREATTKYVHLLKQASKINKMDFEKKEMVRREKLKHQRLIKMNACRQLGNSVGFLVNLHDVFAFVKK